MAMLERGGFCVEGPAVKESGHGRSQEWLLLLLLLLLLPL